MSTYIDGARLLSFFLETRACGAKLSNMKTVSRRLCPQPHIYHLPLPCTKLSGKEKSLVTSDDYKGFFVARQVAYSLCDHCNPVNSKAEERDQRWLDRLPSTIPRLRLPRADKPIQYPNFLYQASSTRSP